MNNMVELIPLAMLAGALLFWGWMFRDLWANPDLPVASERGLVWPPDSKNTWTLVFIVLNLAGAVLYYFGVFRNRR